MTTNYKQLYSLLNDLKFNLNDDNLRHVRNYAAWYILDHETPNDKHVLNNYKCIDILLDFVIEESFTNMFEENQNFEIKNNRREL